jgi:dTDP-4-dehydrorhamnose 3,5-epimerase
VVDIEPLRDERGFFARTFCADEHASHGLCLGVTQCSTFFNVKAATLSGMHFLATPHGEDKLMRCVSGAIFDAIVDIRTDSSTYRPWLGVELSAENRRQ